MPSQPTTPARALAVRARSQWRGDDAYDDEFENLLSGVSPALRYGKSPNLRP